MNRRNLLKTIGASPLISAVGTVAASTTTEDYEPEYPPTYITLLMPSIDVQMLHISIMDEHLRDSDYIRVHSDNHLLNLALWDVEVSDEGSWTVLNQIIQPEPITRVTVGGVDGRCWDTLDVERQAMAFPIESGKTAVGIVCDDRPVTISTPDDEIIYQVEKYSQRVVGADPSEITIWTVRDDEKVKIPLYSVENWQFRYKDG